MIDFNKIAKRAGIACTAIILALPTPALAATSWRIDPSRTHIAFEIDAIGYPRTHGEFRQFTGRVSIDFGHPNKSSVSFHVQSQSVDVGSTSFDDYMRSSAFLDSSRFPSIDFVSNSVAKLNDHMVRVNGELTLLGVTHPLSVDVAVEREGAGGAQKLTFLAKTNIDRLEFGMNSGFPLVSRDVQLVISSAAVQL